MAVSSRELEGRVGANRLVLVARFMERKPIRVFSLDGGKVINAWANIDSSVWRSCVLVEGAPNIGVLIIGELRKNKPPFRPVLALPDGALDCHESQRLLRLIVVSAKHLPGHRQIHSCA